MMKNARSRLTFDAYNRGDYNEAINRANQALSRSDYNNEEKANLLFVKMESYAQLGKYVTALGVITYIIEKFPDTEGAHKSKALLATVTNGLKKQRDKTGTDL